MCAIVHGSAIKTSDDLDEAFLLISELFRRVLEDASLASNELDRKRGTFFDTSRLNHDANLDFDL